MKEILINNIFKFAMLVIILILALQTLGIVSKAIKANAISKCNDISRFKKTDKAATPNITYEIFYPEKDTYNECLRRVEDTFK
ncbi:MAG: hypothetical protein Q8Q49_03720 [bacterium]|nr:hypothetical protein [bacterium]